MALRDGLEAKFGNNVDYDRFESELTRVYEEINPPTQATRFADAAVEHWQLPEAERMLLAVEQTFFVVNPPDSETKRSYLHLFATGSERVYFTGGDGFTERGWRLRMGVTAEDINSKLRLGTFSPSAEGHLAKVSRNFSQAVFNIAHEGILAEHGLAVREILYTPLDSPSNQ